ncbi:MAG: DinB family protein [Planctomycetes bacterium]|nr:DinB family protein [Planctomycetota bacterium]
MALDPAADHARLARLQAALDQWIEAAGELLARTTPAVSGWSAEQHLAHVALANELVLRNLKSLVAGKGALVVEGGEPKPGVREILESGRLPRGAAQAPRMVRPPETIERELMLGWLADARRELCALDPRAIVSGTLRVPHQQLGPLDAPQWLRFGVAHTRHHLLIAREVLVALEPALGPRLVLPD